MADSQDMQAEIVARLEDLLELARKHPVIRPDAYEFDMENEMVKVPDPNGVMWRHDFTGVRTFTLKFALDVDRELVTDPYGVCGGCTPNFSPCDTLKIEAEGWGWPG